MSQPSVQIPGYEVVATLHESASSIVCRAVRSRDRFPVILKCMPMGTSTSRLLTRLRNEFALLRSLNIKGAMRAYELIQTQGRLALVVEDLPGFSLRNWVARQRPQLAERLRAAIEFAGVIGAVHAAGVIHKDINSQNLIYDQDTAQATLVDFGLATRLRYQEGKFRPATALEGTLAYIAPEQTGRMNRSVDHRADWYSFGVTLYELFSGRLPKESSDPLELVHFHIAGTPAPLHEICDVPVTLSAIVGKLLRKAPEERYQSAAGLVADLQRCLRELEEGAAAAPFEPGTQDVVERFEPPQKLYGRDREAAVLVETLHQVAAGKVCTVRVAGVAGIGKTSLVQEMHESITGCRGLFASGKFDQLRRDTPFSALVDALQELVEQLLTGGPEAVEQWRLEIRAAVGGNGRVLLDVIPSLELIIGEQPEVPALTGFEAQNRFTLVFQNFIQVFARRAHPLVLFLDDMQWADPASLGLLTQMLARTDTESLLVIQAYRDNELDATHPFALTMQEQDKRGITASSIRLGPVQVADVAALLADGLRVPEQTVQPLATLICQKTGGNPFFIRQFLRTLHAGGLLTFDPATRSFTWDLEAMRGAAITENVAEFLAAKLARLPEGTRDALRFAAAIGARFDLATLATALRVAEQEAAERLQPALAEELVLALTPLESLDPNAAESALVHRRYAFLHDRVQSAAYDLIRTQDRAALHLRIGRLLGGGAGAEELGPRLFDVVNHLNQGASLIEDEQERLNLVRLNYWAAIRARNSTAYALAVRCLRQAIALIGGEAGWEHHHRRVMEAHLKLAEVLALSAAHAEAFVVIEKALKRAQSRLQRTQLRALQVQTHLSIGQMAEALACGCAAASEFDIELPQDAASLGRVLPGQIGTVLDRTDALGIEKLLDLPMMEDAEKMALMALLTHCLPAAFQTNQQLYALICCRMIELSLQAGNCAHSARGYVSFAGVLSNAMGRYGDAYRFAKLAVDLLHKLGDASVLPGAYFVWGLLASHWVKPVEESIDLYRKGVLHGLATGDHLHAAYSAARSVSHQQFRGAPLADVHEEALAARDLLLRVGEMHKLAYLEPRIRFIEWLRGQGGGRQDLAAADATEAECTAAIKARGNLSFESEWFILLLMNRYLRGEYREALAFARQSQQLLPFSAAFVTRSEHTLFYALTLAALLPTAAADEREEFRTLLDTQEAEFAVWSRECPENFRHAHLLVSAERARVEGLPLDAMHLYDQALAAAGEHGFLNMETLAAELAARFWFDAGKSDFGSLYIERAIQAAESWGAQCRISALRQRFGVRGRAESGTTGSTSRGAEQSGDALDLATLLKASQVLSGEIVLDRLLAKLLEIILENAGGDRAVLVLHEQGRPLIQGVRDSAGGETRLLMGESLYGSRLLSEGIANYVIRTRENLVLAEPAHSGRFRQDAYVVERRPRSVLCAPIQHKGRLTGLIYLENNQIAGAFTAERLEALNVLMLQIAVSIENAMLYAQREQQARNIEQANTALKREIAERVHAEQELARLSATKLDELGGQVRERTRELEAAKLRLEEEARAREQVLAQLAESNEQIRALAFEDGLTGLPNRRVLHEHLEKVLGRSSRRRTEFAVLFVDLDNFKRINDTVGHQTADEVLRQLADTLSELIRTEDTLGLYLRRGLDPESTASHSSIHDSVVSRVGGDEFVILLPELRDRLAAGTVAHRILQRLERPFALGDAQVFVTASIGIATFPADGTSAAELLRNADTAMYHAKQQGKAAFQYYSGEMNAASMQRLRVENGLRLALESGGFELHYQPQFEIATRRIVGAEALLRWRDQGRLVYPGTFIGVAEDSGLILKMGEWVIREACRQAREWQRLGLPTIPISVNVSPLQFRRQDLVGLIAGALHEHGLDAGVLRVEITESSLMNVREDATQALHELREMGVQVALDDFGTGYSSLNYLRSFPVDLVKIDGSFIAQMQQDEKTAAVIEAIINVARVLGMKVLAEGVEQRAQLERLRGLGCDFVQGRYTGAPLIPRDFAPLLSQLQRKAALRTIRGQG